MKLRRKWKRIFALYLAFVLCLSVMHVTAFAAEDRIENEDGTVTVKEITTEVWREEGGSTSGSETTTVTVTTDDDDRIVSGTTEVSGTETITTTGEETSSTEIPSIGDDVIVVTTKPGETETEVVDLDRDALLPDTTGEEWTTNDDGSYTKTEEVENGKVVTTVTTGEDEDGNTVCTTETVITTEETTNGITTIEDVPDEGTTENEDGSITTVTVETDEDGNVTSYTEVTEVRNEEGVVISSTTKVVSAGSATTKTTTKTTTKKTQTIPAEDPTVKVTVTMGEVEAGKNQGATHTSGLDVDMSQFAPADGIDFDALGEDDLVFVAGVGIKSKHEITIMWGQNINSINSKNSLYATQYIVVDKEGNKHVVYCADMSVPADSDMEYYLTNVEDADYYTNSKNHGSGQNNLKDPEGGAHLREIATNGYWGTKEGTGSLDQVIQDLLKAKADGNETLANVSDEDIKALTSDLALSATQAAIWRYGNSMTNGVLWWGTMSKLVDGTGLSYDEKTATFTRVTEGTDPETGKDFVKTETWTLTAPPGLDPSEMIEVKYDADGKIVGVTYPTFINAFVKLIPDGWLNGTSSLHTLIYGEAKDSYENRMATAIYNYLCGLDVNQEDKTTDLIQPSDIVEAVTAVKGSAGTDKDGNALYDADVSFVLTVEPERLNGDLLVRVYDSETGELITTRRVAGDASNDDESIGTTEATKADKGMSYKIDGLTLANGKTIRLTLEGSQTVEKGAYLITAKKYKDSQTFVGIEVGTRDVELSFTLKLDVEGGVETTEQVVTEETTEWSKESGVVYSYYELELPENPPTPPETPPETPPTPPETPPTPPETPPTPRENPPTPPETPPTPPETPPVVDIPEPPVPQAEEPADEETTELVDIDDEEVPLVELIDIEDEDVPLADVPVTGDISTVWYFMILLSATGMMILLVIERGKAQKN